MFSRSPEHKAPGSSSKYREYSFANLCSEHMLALEYLFVNTFIEQIFAKICLLFRLAVLYFLQVHYYYIRKESFMATYGKISAKQQEILDFLKNQILNTGYPPTVREICDAVHLSSTSSVFAHLEKLEKNGYIRRDPTKPRAIEIIDDNFNLVRREVVNVPMIGEVAAGQPLLAIQNINNYFPIPAEYMPNSQTFMLKVKGESMINAGIFSGDTILVEQCSSAHNGDMVVALVDDSATVKTFYKEDGHIRLQPENDNMDPIIVDDCQILGRVFGVFRFF